uniref:Uncharacterized protein n=1 Tax=Oryza glumipatula TaxID=40148 RepID=A0A0D9ZHD6_9ORYZ
MPIDGVTTTGRRLPRTAPAQTTLVLTLAAGRAVLAAAPPTVEASPALGLNYGTLLDYFV